MLLDKKIKFHLNDISLVPAKSSRISSRAEVNPHYIKYDDNGLLKYISLPIIVSPMDTVIDGNNWTDFFLNGMPICIPRTYRDSYDYLIKHNNTMFSDSNNLIFLSYSLDEIEYMLRNRKPIRTNILIDIANGHMKRLELVVKLFKLIVNEDIKLMVGNVANPETYKVLAEAGADFIRLGIGGGSACTTSANVSIHYPMGSLIKECREIKMQNEFQTKIIADGGFKNYDQIIKALALGADYVMLGGILSKTIESLTKISKPKLFNKININNKFACKYIISIIPCAMCSSNFACPSMDFRAILYKFS